LTAPEVLKCDSAVYITYNLGQDLALDVECPRAAVLLRIVLRLLQLSNVACVHFFQFYPALLPHLEPREKALMKLIKALLQAQNSKTFFIGVDEIGMLCRWLNGDAAGRILTSVLGDLAVFLLEHGIQTTTLLSALTEKTWATITGIRPVWGVDLPPIGKAAHEFVRNQVLKPEKATAANIALIEAFCGFHFRSIVVACEEINEGSFMNWDWHQLYVKLVARFSECISVEWKSDVRRYVLEYIRGGFGSALRASPNAGQFTDAVNAIPPVLVCDALNCDSGFADHEHPLQQLFGISAFASAEKQLEWCGYHYDRFRALYGLPVVPYGMLAQNSADPGWFGAMRFSQACVHPLTTDSLFETKDKVVVRTGVKPRRGTYYFPSQPNHPYIDRAVVAHHSVRPVERCLVLYQDNIHSQSFSAAVEALNTAADAFVSEGWKKSQILCVAHVIGASKDTRSQSDFKYPYLLVRDHELNLFYTPSLAPTLMFARSRHLGVEKT
jgi:hypothetical protein